MSNFYSAILGCEKLAIIEENIVLAFSASGDSDDTRFTTVQNRAAMVRLTYSIAARRSDLFYSMRGKGTRVQLSVCS